MEDKKIIELLAELRDGQKKQISLSEKAIARQAVAVKRVTIIVCILIVVMIVLAFLPVKI